METPDTLVRQGIHGDIECEGKMRIKRQVHGHYTFHNSRHKVASKRYNPTPMEAGLPTSVTIKTRPIYKTRNNIIQKGESGTRREEKQVL